MCSNFTDHQLKMDYYKYSLIYVKHIITINQKSTRDVRETERKEYKHSTTESHQHTVGLAGFLGTRGFSEWQMSTGFNLRSPAAWALPGEAARPLSSEARPGLPASYKRPRQHLLPARGCVVSSETRCLEEPPSRTASARPSGKPAAPSALPLRRRLLSTSAPATQPLPASETGTGRSVEQSEHTQHSPIKSMLHGCGLRHPKTTTTVTS